MAGHTIQGLYCECPGGQNCICDPDEELKGQTVSETGDEGSLDSGATPPETGADLGPGLLLATLGLLLWMRMRA